jgi:two-component system NarL family response regulator
MRGKVFLSSQFQAVESVRAGSDLELPVNRLTLREREILQLLAEGKSNKQVAETLRISSGTVETHRKKIIGKLQLHSAAELVRYAIRNNLAKP